jgi:hypothetical protein
LSKKKHGVGCFTPRETSTMATIYYMLFLAQAHIHCTSRGRAQRINFAGYITHAGSSIITGFFGFMLMGSLGPFAMLLP